MDVRHLFVVVVLAGTAVSAVALVADSERSTASVEVENGSAYEVGASLEFDVPKESGEYELFADGNWLLMRKASGGTFTVDSSGLEAGPYELIDAESGKTVYTFELTVSEDGSKSPTPTPSPTPTETPTPDIVLVENGSTYRTGTVLEFDVPKAEGHYDVFAQGNWVMVRGASEGSLVLDTAGLDPGDYELADEDTGETTYVFRLAADGETTTPSRASTTSPTSGSMPTGTATARSDQAGTDTDSSNEAGRTARSATDSPSSRPTTDREETSTTPTSERTDPTTVGPDRTATTVPGFGPVAALAAVVVALVALRRGPP